MYRFVCRLGSVLGAISFVLLTAGVALAAPQFSPSATALLHTLQVGGGPGTSYNSGGLGSGGEIQYTNLGGGTGSLNITSEIDVLNYYDPSNGACATDIASNCAYNFALEGGSNLDFEVNAVLNGVSVTNIGGTVFQIDIMFESAGLGNDFIWTDPLDGGSTVLSASWTSGTFGGVPTSGLQAQVFYDAGTSTTLGGVNVTGFATIDSGIYSSLFGSDLVAIDSSQFFDFSPDFDTITQAVIDTGEIPSFTGEIQGQIFRADSGQFVPEPGTALLVGAGLFALARRGRRS